MKLKIGKTQYDVSWPDTLEPPIVRGRIDYRAATIQIAKRAGSPRRARSPKGLNHTFWHEVVHGILYDMGSRKYRDEQFVDELAKRIMQVREQLAKHAKERFNVR
jgi:hypothetical protein